MGRQNKVGLDYFELDCHMDEKVRLIQAEYGLKGFAVVVKLYQEIYGGHGYYCEWTQDRELLFASENGLNGGSFINNIVAACIKRDIFSERLFKEYGVLSSTGVQKQYLKATVKREVVELKKEYLLITVPKNRVNVVINSISSTGNSISDGRNEQSREENSREEYIPPISPLTRFDDFISSYPKQTKNRQAVETAYCKLFVDDVKLNESDLITAAGNYAEACRILGTEDRYIKAPQNFLKDNFFVDYLEDNYEKPVVSGNKKTAFTDFSEQKKYNFDELERKLLSR